ncbi:MAG TPA: hypothetical protein P5224_07615, partial [Mesotoga sp.]|nr:hypothetical protein [Mesotoga sp.]
MRTKVTAIPNPFAVLMSFETDMKEHIPRKLLSTILLVSAAATIMTKGLSGTPIYDSPLHFFLTSGDLAIHIMVPMM